MKLQGLSIVFVLIIIPVVLVFTYYLQLQIETISIQSSYDTKLLDATHGAMVALELNTANEDLSSVADSLRTIIDASNNIFINTLSTNMGLSHESKSYLEPYIPAVLYTLYDGYYINSPTKTPVIGVDSKGVALEIEPNKDQALKDKFSISGLKYSGGKYIYNSEDTNYYPLGTLGNTNAVPASDYGSLLYKTNKNNEYTTNLNDKNISYKTEHVLKSYMPYSARYVSPDKKIDVTINYTLDNFMTVVGTVDGAYYTKSGYLIKSNSISSITTVIEVLTKRFQNESLIEEKIKEELNKGTRLNVSLRNDSSSFNITTNDINSPEAEALIYYVKAYAFSKWVYENLGTLRECDIVENLSNKIVGTTKNTSDKTIYSFSGKNNKIFDSTQNPEDKNSTFVNHKTQVIRNSIQYNLNLAMSIYNERTTTSYDYSMPMISEKEWENITENVSIVSFLQGVKCGLKTYNNYAVVYSTNNEFYVPTKEIYFVLEEKFNDENSTYHRIDCPKLKEEVTKARSEGRSNSLISFISKEVKYDKILEKDTYVYDHKNVACYTCIVDGNYKPTTLDSNLLKNYYIGVSKERYNLYKTNEIRKSEGYEIIYDKKSQNSTIRNGAKYSKSLNKIKSVEITFGAIKAEDIQDTVVNLNINLSDIAQTNYTLNTNQTKEQTIKFDLYSNNASTKLNRSYILNRINKDSMAESVTLSNIRNAITCIKVIYK